MDEQILFDRFHDALDMEPRPGAYERMRLAMTDRPDALKARPAFRMRYSKMGFRIAAGLTAAVIVIAVVASFVAGHPGLMGSAPAGDDPNFKAYQAMISSDYEGVRGTDLNNCISIQDTYCQAALNAIIPPFQKWVRDLNSFRAPSQFVVIDGQLRAHLNEAIAELNAAKAFQNAGNENGFNRALDAESYERAWLDPTMYAILGSYPRVAGTYHDAFRMTQQSLDGCVNGSPAPADFGCAGLVLGKVCSSGPDLTCESATRSAATQIQTFLIALLQNPAPSSLTSKNAQLQADLAKADSAVLATTDARLSGDVSKVRAAESSFAAWMRAADNDATALGNP